MTLYRVECEEMRKRDEMSRAIMQNSPSEIDEPLGIYKENVLVLEENALAPVFKWVFLTLQEAEEWKSTCVEVKTANLVGVNTSAGYLVIARDANDALLVYLPQDRRTTYWIPRKGEC